MKKIKIQRKEIKAILISIFTTLLLFSCATHGKMLTSIQTAALRGMIYDAKSRPCSLAEITLYVNEGKIKKTVKSDFNGRFVIPGVPGGKHRVEAKKEGFETNSSTIEFSRISQILYIKVTSMDTLLNRTENHLVRLEWNQAKKSLERAKEIDPKHSRYLLLFGVYKLKTGFPEEAISAWIKLIAKGHRDIYLYLILADTYQYTLHQDENALIWLEKAQTIENDSDISERIKELKRE